MPQFSNIIHVTKFIMAIAIVSWSVYHLIYWKEYNRVFCSIFHFVYEKELEQSLFFLFKNKNRNHTHVISLVMAFLHLAQVCSILKNGYHCFFHDKNIYFFKEIFIIQFSVFSIINLCSLLWFPGLWIKN